MHPARGGTRRGRTTASRDPAEIVVSNEPRELPTIEDIAPEVIEPDRLAVPVERCEIHVVTLMQDARFQT